MTGNTACIWPAVAGSAQSWPPKVTWQTCWPAPRQSYTAQPRKPRPRRSAWMPQRKSGPRWRQGWPAGLSMAKSAEREKAGTTQHSPAHRAQSARSSGGSVTAFGALGSLIG